MFSYVSLRTKKKQFNRTGKNYSCERTLLPDIQYYFGQDQMSNLNILRKHTFTRTIFFREVELFFRTLWALHIVDSTLYSDRYRIIID